MKAIVDLTRRDVRRATSNVMAVIVMVGLVVIPSLFTWFNVIASWDPFSNTRSLKVAVASTDAGFESDLVPIRINVGEQVLSALRANEDLDWVITSEHDAIDGTRSGEYYAAIVLPKTFSADMLTFYSGDAERTDLAYYTNEKKNALAPKITDQGAEGISAQITQVFTRTLGDVSLGLVSSMSDFLTDADTKATMARLESRVSAVAGQLRSGADTASMFSTVIQASVPLVDSASSLIQGSSAAFDDAKNAVGGGVADVDALQNALGTATNALSDALTATAAGYDAVGASVDELFARTGDVAASQADVLTTTAGAVDDQIARYTALRDRLTDEVRPSLPEAALPALDTVVSRLDEAISRQQDVSDRLTQAADQVRTGSGDAQKSHDEISAVIADAKAAVEKAKTAYTHDLQPRLDALGNTLDGIRSDVAAIGADLDGAAARLSGSSGTVRDTLAGAQTATTQIGTTLRTTADKFDTLQKALAQAADTGDLSSLSAVIGSDPSVLASALASPVRVDRTAVFPVASFGAAMSPLYMVLALWVGALLMTVTIRVDVPADALPAHGELTPTQKYLGRYGVFALTGLAQSTLLALGLILFVQIDAVHPFLLLLAAWVTSLVFTLVVYTAVVAFGNAGKALAVLLLVIQISSSGGAYPLQLLPQWFQNISPFMPATHAVAALRSAIAGVYQSDFWVSLGWLAAFILPALLLGLVLRRPLISFNRGLIEALESTKLM